MKHNYCTTLLANLKALFCSWYFTRKKYTCFFDAKDSVMDFFLDFLLLLHALSPIFTNITSSMFCNSIFHPLYQRKQANFMAAAN